MNNPVSKTQINLLGDNLRKGELTVDQIKMLDVYRRSFHKPYEITMNFLRNELSLEPTGRPSKSTSSIIEKLIREKSRLVTIQDIAGCRIVLPDINEQNRVLDLLIRHFPEARIIDRRVLPRYGYRAVHFVPIIDEKPIEIQLRTVIQHRWAELSERLADDNRAIKYGGGVPDIRAFLDRLSNDIALVEEIEKDIPSPDAFGGAEKYNDFMQRLQKAKTHLVNLLIEKIELLT